MKPQTNITNEFKNAVRLGEIQSRLVAKKDATNKFGGYKYRSCESILAALKPILKEYGYSILLKDDIIVVADRVYVKSFCYLVDENGSIVAETTAYAREALAKKGMDDSQCTGSASSYARKYALCGMFAIDDSSVDPDATNDHKDGDKLNEEEITLMEGAANKDELTEMCKALVNRGKSREEVSALYKKIAAKLAK